MDPNKTLHAKEVKANGTSIIQVRNPNWVAYPAWHSNDTEFNKFFQCQKRTLGGLPELFLSCSDTLNTGRQFSEQILNIEKYMGNDTLYFFSKGMPVNGSTQFSQLPPYFWSGFFSYPFTYHGETIGPNYTKLTLPTMFSKQHAMHFALSQSDFTYIWQKETMLYMPISDTFRTRGVFPKTYLYVARRFIEVSATWDALRHLGVPKDSYGMPYVTPHGMASLEKLASYPVYVGTPHSYGNALWGGVEFQQVLGTVLNQASQFTFIDYDPVTGMALRKALRQQLNFRWEMGPLMPNIFSSQHRCSAPTKSFADATGYGCFSYIPLLWFEDARVMENEVFFRLADHFYGRPGRNK